MSPRISPRFVDLLQRSARIRQFTDRELRSRAPSPLRLIRLRRLSMLFEDKLRRALASLAAPGPALVPVSVRSHPAAARRA